MLLPAFISTLILLVANQHQQVDAWWFSTAPTGLITATATFDLDGVQGTFKFSQANPSAPTECQYDIQGLQGNNKFYHVHVRPVPVYDPQLIKSNATAIAQLCGDPATGGHLNPHHITEKLPAKSAPLDKYEIGDLSGKHGPLEQVAGHGHEDHYVGKFSDSHLPLSGDNSIVGRSIVIHKNDGKRWVCATIVEYK